MKVRHLLQIILILSFASANTILIPEDYTIIQNGIDASSDGDTVLVNAGFYSENINFNGKAIIVTSYYDVLDDSLLVAATVIDAGEDGSVVTFDSEENESSILAGFTLQNGNGNYEDPDGNGSYYTYGGGVYCKDSDPIIKDCIIQNNTGNAGGGGGVFCYNSSPTFIGCIIANNSTDDVGGGLYTRNNSNPHFEYCTFSNNYAEYGGGGYLRHESTPSMTHVSFINNLSNNSGGAVVLKDDANLNATHFYVIGNEADGLGGGLYVNNASPQIHFGVFSNNTSSSGGGIYIRNNTNATLENVTVAYNNAGLYGDGIYMRDGSVLSIINSILWNNNESQIYFRSEGNDVELNIDYTCVTDGENGIIDNDNGDVNWGEGNIESEPYFCNGPGGNFYLRENSPCVNGGENNGLMGCFESGCGPVNVGPIWYVDANGNDSNDGSDETPFESIARAVTACMDGDTIRLNPGVYSVGTLDFESKAIVLESRAFETNNLSLIEDTYFAPSNIGGSSLFLDGTSNNNGTIKGVSIRGGSDPFGGGLVLMGSSPTFEEVIIEGNNAEIGGGVYISNSDASFKNCTIRNNGANIGGGVYITDATPTFLNVSILDNIAYWGAGLYSENSEPTIQESKFSGNTAYIEGGGVYQTGGMGSIEWTLFENNQGFDYGGCIVAHEATIDLNQITISKNYSGTGSALAFHSSAVSILNSILWNNEGQLFYIPDGSGLTSLNIGYTDIEGGTTMLNELSNTLLDITGDIYDLDPEFCSPTSNNFSLSNHSPLWTVSNEGGVVGAVSDSCQVLTTIDQDPILSTFNLSQNFPNPFNPSTRIEFSLEAESYHQLNVYDIQGVWVATLSQGFLGSGRHQVQWKGTNHFGEILPSGIYLYTLQTPSGQLTRKMMYIK